MSCDSKKEAVNYTTVLHDMLMMAFSEGNIFETDVETALRTVRLLKITK